MRDAMAALERLDLFPVRGRVLALRAGEVAADGPDAAVGAHCLIGGERADAVRAEVVNVSADGIVLLPFGRIDALRIGDRVEGCPLEGEDVVGEGFAGRAVDALGAPLDGGTAIRGESAAPYRVPPVLDRIAPTQRLVTGIRAIDGLLTLGKGQRVGIFAASGVGKTSLVEQLLRQASCDRVVICLVGERGREVEAFWRAMRQSRHAARTTLVAATSDESAPMRARAVDRALRLAEHWRDRGEDVLLVVDSITRLAMALREIGLVAGEPPTARAYTPNVFRELPVIVERCGAIRGGGSITAVFSVLSETDDIDDPIVEVMKSLLDGHILLSREMAQAGHFPAIDIGRSISRLFAHLVDADHREAATYCRTMLAVHDEARILIESGMYKAGSDRVIDAAIAMRDGVQAFLRQPQHDASGWDQTRAALLALSGRAGRG